MSVLPTTITYDILKNYQKDDIKKVRQVSGEWMDLMESVLKVAQKNSLVLAVHPEHRYFFYDEARDQYDSQQTKHFAQLDEAQSKKLGELRVMDSQALEATNVTETFDVDLNEASQFWKLQFPRLHVEEHYGDLEVVLELVPTQFEEIRIRNCILESFLPFPDTLKRLDLENCFFSLKEDNDTLLSFLLKMTWETVSILDVNLMGPLEPMLVEAWVAADDPQLKHFSSDRLNVAMWKTFFDEIEHKGERVDDSTLLVPHSKLDKKLRLTISETGEGPAVLDVVCV
uniref:F-box domain-containing protein n=1 Tax=Steinernema glaseri TaxID=37863 RepID=A0A1I7ZPS2_9BILA